MSKIGTVGWFGLAAYIIAWDIVAAHRGHETLSAAFWRGMSSRRTAVIVIGLTASVNKHLLAPNFLPQVDFIKIVGDRTGRRFRM